jgi:hypothetical protein
VTGQPRGLHQGHGTGHKTEARNPRQYQCNQWRGQGGICPDKWCQHQGYDDCHKPILAPHPKPWQMQVKRLRPRPYV